MVRDPRAGPRWAAGRSRLAAARSRGAQPARRLEHGRHPARRPREHLAGRCRVARVRSRARPGGAADRDRARAASAPGPCSPAAGGGGAAPGPFRGVRCDRGAVRRADRRVLDVVRAGRQERRGSGARDRQGAASGLRRGWDGRAHLHGRQRLVRAAPAESLVAGHCRLRLGEDRRPGLERGPRGRGRGCGHRRPAARIWHRRAGRRLVPSPRSSAQACSSASSPSSSARLRTGRSTSSSSPARARWRSSSPRVRPEYCLPWCS